MIFLKKGKSTALGEITGSFPILSLSEFEVLHDKFLRAACSQNELKPFIIPPLPPLLLFLGGLDGNQYFPAWKAIIVKGVITKYNIITSLKM